MSSSRHYVIYAFLCLVLILGSCTTPESALPTTSPARSAESVATFTVARGKVVKTLDLTGFVVPVGEEPLYLDAAVPVDRVLVQQGQSVNAGDVLAEVGGKDLLHQIALAELGVSLATARLRQAESDNVYAIALAKVDLALAREELSRTQDLPDSYLAEAAVKRAELALSQLEKGVSQVLLVELQQAESALEWLTNAREVVAPADGIVISLALYPGYPVDPSRPVAILADSSRMEIGVELPEQQLQAMAEGDRIEIVRTVQPERILSGIITHLPYPYGNNNSDGETSIYQNTVRIRLESEVDGLAFGDPLSLVMVVEERDNVLWVPPDAIYTIQGRTFVNVQDGEVQRRADVVLGLVGQERVEILQGLEEDQVVVFSLESGN